MSSNDNGGFLRTIFWALLIGSFGWTTFVGWGLAQNFSAHCTEQKTEFTEVRKETNDKLDCITTKVADKLENISTAIAELKTDIKYIRKETLK